MQIEILFHKYKEDVNNFLLYYLKTTDIEDVLQETFIHAYKALSNQISISNERSWLISIARHTAIDFLRKEKSQIRKISKLKNEPLHQAQLTIEEKLQIDERNKMILNEIYQMKHSYQEVIILRGIKEFSIIETAEILNWKENKVKVTYHRALKKLAKILQGGDFL